MAASRSRLARLRIQLASLGALALMLIAMPGHADNSPPPPPSLAQAQQALANANSQAHVADSALGQADANLASSQQQLLAVTSQLTALNQRISQLAAEVSALKAQENADKNMLANYLREAYTGGPNRGITYILSASSFDEAVGRQVSLQHIADASQQLSAEIGSDESKAQADLAQTQASQAKLAVLQAQALAAEQVLADEQAQVQAADKSAHGAVGSAKNTLEGILAASQAPPSKGPTKIQYAPVPASTFTIDTDLTQPSGLTADQINQFLSGTALAGTGQAFIDNEKTHHVSARYFVAHAILESAWGNSRIAHDKHNLFGYGADDANPYGDAMSFPSFAACIDYVGSMVEKNYLTPGGPFFHGPTLRGMNVDYASDPYWANKIASLAVDIP